MTVGTTEPRVVNTYTGPKDYTFLFEVFEDSDLLLTHYDTLGVPTILVLSTDYTVTLVTGVDGGTCHLTYVPTTGTLDIRRNLTIEQGVDWVNNNPLDMDILETAFDRLTMVVQQMNTVIVNGESTATWRDAWTTATLYPVKDIVVGADTNWYYCLETHTSGTFSTDLAAGKWVLMLDVAALTVISAAAAASAAAALVSENAAAASAVATAADAVDTALDAIATASDASDTAADVVSTAADVVSTAADTIQTALDVIAAAASATAAAASAASINIDPPVANKHGTLIAQNGADDGYERITAQGSADEVLTSNGPDALPSFKAGNSLPAPGANKHGILVIQNDADDGYEQLGVQGSAGEVLTSAGSDAKPTWGASIFAGSILAWPSATPPTGFLECDGSAISRTTYSTLFTTVSDDYGSGDGSTTFNLPDYRGEFLRGWDNSAGVDPDAASRTDRGDGITGDNIGTRQADELKAHIHTVPFQDQAAQYDSGSNNAREINSTPTSSTGGNETRPTNVNVMWVIKY